METYPALLALCEGNPPATSGFPSQRRVTRSCDIFCCNLCRFFLLSTKQIWTSRQMSITLLQHQCVKSYCLRCLRQLSLRSESVDLDQTLHYRQIDRISYVGMHLYDMMTSSNGNIFRVTGHLCGEFTGPRWIPRTKASYTELWCFLWSAPE